MTFTLRLTQMVIFIFWGILFFLPILSPSPSPSPSPSSSLSFPLSSSVCRSLFTQTQNVSFLSWSPIHIDDSPVVSVHLTLCGFSPNGHSYSLIHHFQLLEMHKYSQKIIFGTCENSNPNGQNGITPIKIHLSQCVIPSPDNSVIPREWKDSPTNILLEKHGDIIKHIDNVGGKYPSPSNSFSLDILYRISYPFDFRRPSLPTSSLFVFVVIESLFTSLPLLVDGEVTVRHKNIQFHRSSIPPQCEIFPSLLCLAMYINPNLYIITPSLHSQNLLIQRGAISGRVFMIPHGIHKEYFKPKRAQKNSKKKSENTKTKSKNGDGHHGTMGDKIHNESDDDSHPSETRTSPLDFGNEGDGDGDHMDDISTSHFHSLFPTSRGLETFPKLKERDMAIPPSLPPSPFPLPPSCFLFLHVGSMSPGKGIRALLSSFLKFKFKNSKLKINFYYPKSETLFSSPSPPCVRLVLKGNDRLFPSKILIFSSIEKIVKIKFIEEIKKIFFRFYYQKQIEKENSQDKTQFSMEKLRVKDIGETIGMLEKRQKGIGISPFDDLLHQLRSTNSEDTRDRDSPSPPHSSCDLLDDWTCADIPMDSSSSSPSFLYGIPLSHLSPKVFSQWNKYFPHLVEWIDSTLSTEIIYIGDDLTPERQRQLYSLSSCYVHPFMAEGFSLPIMEAMAVGLPIIVSMGGAPMEYQHKRVRERAEEILKEQMDTSYPDPYPLEFPPHWLRVAQQVVSGNGHIASWDLNTTGTINITPNPHDVPLSLPLPLPHGCYPLTWIDQQTFTLYPFEDSIVKCLEKTIQMTHKQSLSALSDHSNEEFSFGFHHLIHENYTWESIANRLLQTFLQNTKEMMGEETKDHEDIDQGNYNNNNNNNNNNEHYSDSSRSADKLDL